MKILIIGSEGFLGRKIYNIFSKKHEVIRATLNPIDKNTIPLDATSRDQVFQVISEQKPDVVIDLVALTSSLECEKNPKLCEELNFNTAKNIALACKKFNSKMIFISSSYVFDGIKGNYSEEDKTSPNNLYGKYKVLAEKKVLELENSIVIRTNLMYGYNGKDKPNGVFDKILSREDITIGDPNQLRNPILVDDVAFIILDLLNKKEKGLFHIGGKEKITMFDFLSKLEKIVRKESKIKITSEKSIVNHPKKDTLCIKKIDETCPNIIHPLEEGLNILKSQISD